MYIHPRIKVAAFLLVASGIGGFALATKLTQYFFEKHQARAGGNDRDQETEEKNGNGKKKTADGEGEAQQTADGQQDDDGEGDGKFKAGDELNGAEAIKYLVGKTIRMNPGQRPLRYSYHARRGLFGEGDAPRYSLRTWSTRGMNLCESQPRGLLECYEVTVIIGPLAQPKGKGKDKDVALTPEEVRELVQEAKKSSTWAQKKSADKAAVKRDESLRGGALLQTGDPDEPPREYADGEQMATMVIGERAYPVLKGNLIAFPKFIPTIDKPKVDPAEAAKPAADKAPDAAETAPAAPKPPSLISAAQASPEPPKPKGFQAPRQAAGFGDPRSTGQNFGAPKQKAVARSFQAVNAGGDPGIVGQEAWDRILGKTMAPIGAKPLKPLPYLGFFQPDGHFLQLTRDKDMPLEVMVYTSNWTFKEGRLCYSAPVQASAPAQPPPAKPGAKPAPAPKKGPAANCVAPSLAGEETNLFSFLNQRLAISTRLELPTRDALKAQDFGPPRPANFRPVGAAPEALRNAPPPAETPPPGPARI